MNKIAYIDIEVNPANNKILDIGSIKNDGSTFHKTSVIDLLQFLNDVQYICGHNILNHDLKYIGNELNSIGINSENFIDTLFLSPLLFPTKPYHALLKDDKLQTDEVNNPLNDSIKAKDLFNDEIAAFKQLDEALKEIFYLLLNDKKEFKAFFRFTNYSSTKTNLEELIRRNFENEICKNIELSNIITEQPIEFAYCLSLISSFTKHKKSYSITPPWVLKNYPSVEQIMFRMRNKPCITGCTYCNTSLDVYKGL